jgi:ELAV like protein 2/3/4
MSVGGDSSSDSGSSGSITNVSITNNNIESKTNLIVNYLPQSMISEEFKALFQSIGQLESCKLIKDKKTNQNLGYGFVNYVNIDDADRAIQAINGLKIENKIIKVSYARPSCDNIKGANLYISGIPKNWSINELNLYFSSCGKIITSRILVNSNNQSKGIGFVRYDTKNEADSAINKLNGSMPDGYNEKIIVKFANFPAIFNQKYSMSTLASAVSNTSMFQTKIPFHYQINASPSNSCLISPIIQTHNTAWCLFVSNLPSDVEENTLWRLFGPFGAILDVKLVRNQSTQKSKGFGFVKMTSYDDAINAINNLNGLNLGNRFLHVSFKSN